jgi:hypothetical protein
MLVRYTWDALLHRAGTVCSSLTVEEHGVPVGIVAATLENQSTNPPPTVDFLGAQMATSGAPATELRRSVVS